MNEPSKYLQELVNQKKNLANNLVEKGIEASESEYFNTLVPKILDIQTGITPTGTLEITDNGEKDVTQYAKVNVNVPTSSGGEEEIPEDKYHIRYLNIDGTVLKEEYVDEGYTLSPPENPSYDSTYLEFDTWNYDIETLWVDRPYDIGALYKTINDKTYFHIKVTKGIGLTITLALTGITSVDWGDGTVNTSTSHTYANEGNYVISITGSISASTSSSVYLLGSASLNECLLKAYISSVASLINRDYCFYKCYSLEVISLPNVSSKIDVSSRALYYSESLKHINLPKYITSIGEYAIYTKYGGLNSASIPNVNRFESNALTINTDYLLLPDSFDFLNDSYAIQGRIEKIFARNLTYIYDNFGGNCLKEFSFPNGTRSIRRLAFGSDYSKYFDLKDVYIYNNETVPILDEESDTVHTVFAFCNKLLTIWVNDKIIDDLKANTRWAYYANFIKPLSEKMSITLEETPTISLNETVLTITDTNLSSRKIYNIYLNGTLVGSTDFRNMVLDISEMILTTGNVTGNVTVKAIYDNWKESAESNSVNCVVSRTDCIINYSLSPYTFMVVDSTTYTNESGTLTVSSGTKINFKCSNNAASPADLHTKITLDGTIVAEYQGYASGSSEGEIEYELEINSNITVSGVDVETPYIDCGQITITTTGYTVIVQNSGMYGEYGYYSLDNGTTWKNFNELSYNEDVSGCLITNVTQIKFKIDDYAYYNGISTSIWCEEIGLHITQEEPRESENYTLTFDIVVEYSDYD